MLIRLLGFHWALLPALAAEVVPGLDLAPTWTASVLLITGFPKARRWLVVAGWIAVAAMVALLVWHFHH